MITLIQFIEAKPAEIRLGQWFVNCYWKGSDRDSQALYQLDGMRAEAYIRGLMLAWQWDGLPEIDVE